MQQEKDLQPPAPILKKFRLIGLNNYKTIGLTCNSAVKIAAADNGAGKTSLLNAIYAVFVGRPALLYAIEFESLEIEWGNGTVNRWKKRDLFGSMGGAEVEKIARSDFFSQWGVSKSDAVDLITKYMIGDLDEAAQTSAFKDIYRDSPWDKQDLFEQLEAITSPIIQAGQFSMLHRQAQEALGECTVLYLPTYRRIEADIPEYRVGPQQSTASRPYRPRSRQQKDPWDSTKLIFFGMSDVEHKLNSIVNQIRDETLEAYSRSNGQTLEQLVDNSDNNVDVNQEPFDIASIEVVLSRVGKAGALGTRLKAIIESGEIHDQSRHELRRFLSQLLRVYAQRRDDEQAISDFVNAVNGYLSPGEDDIVRKDVRAEKTLSFDKLKLDVAVRNNITDRAIKFGALSSGEKQIVSIFARILLDPRRRYFILVDEPELSLSLDWQQRLLPDIFSTPNCRQLIAITHSPFIFDNYLGTVAGTIDVAAYRAEGANA
jgi:predicted ATP-binding protein involved in virulence